ncbi:ATP-dependent dethiobiotin synthetase BioD [Vibrio sp. S17_S38]|uniref:dethiobiotin synthase n=1 Tax=Vibrio sp. S17_S38 TaxID=2720229 RepID=UPI00167FF42F|nr:dethiobiotin synthase [Vibrio sp. S17_S38]MBD1571711.1 ATP-dependent dethiobiotin synthetase BioD [Vibrio sp. S17_S38]
MINSVFIAGTDTDVGKTMVSQALLRAFSEQGLSTSGYKPVASGSEMTDQGMRNSDALHLQSASTIELEYDVVNPYTLTMPASPHFAARTEGVVIEFDTLSLTLTQHKSAADIVVVEGAGGWRVPISEHEYLSTWVQQEKLPVILVVGVKLGCLSHAILTVEAIESDGLEVVGWVANRINPGTEHYAEIIRMLELKIKAPKLGEIPYLLGSKRKDANKYLDVSSLLE